MNKSVLHVPLKILKIRKNGKQYFTIEHVYQHRLKILDSGSVPNVTIILHLSTFI